MTSGSAKPLQVPPVLVLGLGNPILSDDGLGLELLRALHEAVGDDSRVEFLDGGTQGIALAPFFENRKAVLILDAAALNAQAGTVHVVKNPQDQATPRGIAAHEGNAGEILATAALLGDLPEYVSLVGIEPACLKTHLGLSDEVKQSINEACRVAKQILEELLLIPGISR